MTLSVEVGADVTRLQTGMAVAKAELKDVSAEVKKFADQMVDASEAAQAQLLPQLEAMVAKEAALKAEIAETNTKLKEHKEATEGSAGAFVSLRETTEGLNVRISETKELFTGLGELFLAGLGAEKFIELGSAAAEWGDKLHKANEETGISVENLSALSVSADHADLQFDQLTKGIAKFSVNLQQAESGSGKAAQIFGVLDISQQELKEHGDDTSYMLELVAKKLDEFGNGANKEALVTELFGAKLRDLQPVLNDLAENGLEGMRAKAESVGQLYNGEFAESMKKAHDATKNYEEASHSLAIELGTDLLPAITGVERALVELFTPHSAATQIADLTVYAANIERQIKAIRANGDDPSFWDRFVSGGKTQLAALERELDETNAKIEKLKHPPAEDGPLDVSGMQLDERPQAPALPNLAAERQAAAEAKRLKQEAYQEAIAEDQAEAAQYSATSDQRIAILAKELETARQFWGEDSRQYQQVLREMTAAQREQTQQRLHEGQAAIQADNQAFIQGKNTELQDFIQHEQALVSLKRVTAADAAAQEIRLTEEIYTQEMKRLDVAITLADDDLALHRKLTDQKIALAQKEADQIQKINDKAEDEEARKAIQTDQEIARSGARTGAQLIFGKQTLLQAAEQYAEMAVEKAIEWGLKEVLAHAGFEATKVGATVAGEQAQVAAKVAGTAEGKAVEATAGSASVLGDANKAAAGAYSAVAGIPIIGPILAPIAAGVAFSAVAAFDVFSAEGGIDRVPFDGAPFLLHENETVLSSGPADLLRELVGRGVPDADEGRHEHHHYDFSGAQFGPGLTPSAFKDMLVPALKQARREGAML